MGDFLIHLLEAALEALGAAYQFIAGRKDAD
jgi:hypothetical protein